MALRVISCRFIRLTSRSTPRSLVPIAASAWTCPTSQPVSVLPVHTRSFAKTKKRNSSAVLPPRVEEYDDDNELNDGEEEEPARILAKASKNMKGAVVNFMRALNQMRPSCADGGIFDELHVQAYGHHVLLAQVAQVAIAGTHALSVTVYDASLVQNVKKAIESTNPIYSVRENVNSLEISFPVMSKETRAELFTATKKKAEQARQHVRRVRQDTMNHVKMLKDKVSEDEVEVQKDSIQKMTDDAIAEIGKLLAVKEKDLSTT